MLNENKNIDQLFRDKLGDYEGTPPAFLWTNIQGGLDARRKNIRRTLYKSIGIAAALVLAFMAGWWITSPDNKQANAPAKYADQRSIAAPADSQQSTTVPAEAKVVDSGTPARQSAAPQSVASQIASQKRESTASSAANSLKGEPGVVTDRKSVEPRLSEVEKDFLSELNNNDQVVKPSNQQLASPGKDSSTRDTQNQSLITPDIIKNPTPEKPFEIAMNASEGTNSRRWSLKAEFAPVFNSQAQNSRPAVSLVSNDTRNMKQQETAAENTFSGGMVAGYKVSKRLTVKSGFVFNTIRQTTRNLDFIGVNNNYNVPGNPSMAATPAGQVSLKRVGNVQQEAAAVMNSSYQMDRIVSTPSDNVLKQDIEFIEIPLQATYNFIDSKFTAGITGGLSTNILIGNSAVLSDNGEKISSGETANMRNVVYSSAVGLEMGYEISNRITLTVEPRLKHFINSLSTSKSVNYKPYQMGIVTGLTYSFN